MEFVAPANSNELLKDTVLPFMLEESAIRGRFVRLNEEVHKILSGHKYPVRTSQLLGELLVLTSMLGSMLKLDGILTIQVQGKGAIGFLSTDYTSEGNLRGYAHVNDKERMRKIEAKTRKEQDITELFGKGHIVITIESRNEKPYQAIVPLEGKSLTDCISDFFRQSDQLDTVVEVAINKINKQWHAGGIVLQRIPAEGGKKKKNPEAEENWNRAGILLESVTDKELMDDRLPPSTLLYRLFHEDGVRVFEPSKLQAKCRCSRKRMEDALKGLSKKQLKDMSVKGKITVECHFCSHKEVFEEKQVGI